MLAEIYIYIYTAARKTTTYLGQVLWLGDQALNCRFDRARKVNQDIYSFCHKPGNRHIFAIPKKDNSYFNYSRVFVRGGRGQVRLGRGFANKLASRGNIIVLVCKDQDKLEELAMELEYGFKINTIIVPVDFTQVDTVETVLNGISEINDIGVFRRPSAYFAPLPHLTPA